MRRVLALLACWVICLIAVRASQTPPAPPRPSQTPSGTFRAGIDLVSVDVSVLDKKRVPVRGLTDADFTVFEDGRSRPIVAFAAVNLSPRPADTPVWTNDVSADVASNELPEEGRLVVIVLDRTIPVGEPAMSAKAIARAIVDALGPGDEAAIIFTGPGGRFQDFTTDRARLSRAIEAADVSNQVSPDASAIEAAVADDLFAATGVSLPPIGNTGGCYCSLCEPESVTHVADALRDITRRRKTLFFIGERFAVQGSVAGGLRDKTSIDANLECGDALERARVKMMHALDLAHITIHSIDPVGLATSPFSQSSSPVRGRASAGPLTSALIDGAVTDRLRFQEELRLLPAYTGGRVVMNTNGQAGEVPNIFRESESYYLLGFRSADAGSSTLHKLDVKVNRKDVQVVTRRNYYAPGPPVTAMPVMPLQPALTSVMPRRDIPLQMTAVSVASHGPTGAEVVVTLQAEQSVSQSDITVVVAAFQPDGKAVLAQRQTVRVRRASGAVTASPGRYEIVSRLALRPGRYELRGALEDGASQKTGSVFTSIDVPDFSHEALSASGAMVDVTPRMIVAPDGAVADLLPVVPTAQREFARSDQTRVLVRIGQGGVAPTRPVVLSAKILNARNQVVYDKTSTEDPQPGTRVHDWVTPLPLATLAPGQYLLRLQAQLGKTKVERDVTFTAK